MQRARHWRPAGVTPAERPAEPPVGACATAAFTDPDGHVWEIAQQLGES